jgi:3',5'-cyclic-AMP phosphodiesterase
VARPFLLAQLSDPHVGADWEGADPGRSLAAVVDAVLAVRPRPDAVLVSGDLAEHGDDAEYEACRSLLEPLGDPLHVLPGNHDRRDGLRRVFGAPGSGDEPVSYAADLGPLRLVALDTLRPGADSGELDAGQLAWLDSELARAPATPTLLAMHHPPVAIGIPALDAIGLPPHQSAALAEVLARHPQVRRITAGHVHRVVTAELAGRSVVTMPSTYLQSRLELLADVAGLAHDPPGFALHVVASGEIVTHLQLLPRSA